ncbi:MAG: GDSL-type esterase/lipase family protein [Dehalococcoidia bacterium]|nr:GDSL-type esterase/lipase family protein [Dehalococcoidia bacterium]
MRKYVRLGLLLAVVLALTVLLPGPERASGQAPGYPDSMASLGDSITRAMDANMYGDQPEYSWSTGDNIAVQSQYYRILQENSLISGNNHNDAVSGAKMVDLDGQAHTAVSQNVEYVTILMGANDVCTDTEGHMTSVATFRTQFHDAIDTLTSGLPNARIFVASIPDIYHLWVILHDNSYVAGFWDALGICPPMLASTADDAQRERVRQRNIEFNTVLAEVCNSHPRCRFDNNAVFHSQFGVNDVSTLDYFHPSVAGQANLARLTWVFAYYLFAPVGGLAALPDASGSAGRNYVALDALAAAALVALGAGGWYARRRSSRG